MLQVKIHGLKLVLYKYVSAKNLQDDKVLNKDSVTSIATSKIGSKISTGKELGEIIGMDEEKTAYGSIKITYGKILSK